MSSLLCAICRETLGEGLVNKSCALPCGHVFHDHCVYNWLERSQTCPHCRVAAVQEQVIKLYFDVADDSEISEITALKQEIQKVSTHLEQTQSALRAKSEECSKYHSQASAAQKVNIALRKETKLLSKKLDNLKVIKQEYVRLKEQLKRTRMSLETEKTKNTKLSKDIAKYRKVKMLLDGSADEASNIINTRECLDLDTLKTCFMTIKRDFKLLSQSEAKLKKDYSSLFTLNKSIQLTNTALLEKSSVQERIIENYRSNLLHSTNSNYSTVPPLPPIQSMDVGECNPEPSTSKQQSLPRRSPRNMKKNSEVSMKTKSSSTKELSYDGLGGHSAQDDFPSAKLRPCRIVSNRRK